MERIICLGVSLLQVSNNVYVKYDADIFFHVREILKSRNWNVSLEIFSYETIVVYEVADEGRECFLQKYIAFVNQFVLLSSLNKL